jgi:tetratricopeptide (TPR) repeat protein
MTPEYASPEQMRGQRIGAPSDVYSLGVLLYKLLTGTLPYEFKSKAPYDIVQAVCEQQPLPPSSVVGSERLDGDLDDLILKSLQKDPDDRYPTARQFSEDISLYLEGLPIKARKASVISAGSQFLKRNRVYALASLTACLLLALGGLAWILYPVKADMMANPGITTEVLTLGNANGGTFDSEAYSLYLRAQHLWGLRLVRATREAIPLYEEAIVRDPNFSLAYSGLANSYFLLSVWGGMEPDEGFGKARHAAQKAIELAPDNAQGHLSMAMVEWLHEWNWAAADAEFKKANELGHNYALAPHWYGLFLAEMGKFDEAIASISRAIEMEPLSLPINGDLGRVLYYARRYPESLFQFRKVLDLNPKYTGFGGELIELYEATNMTREWASHFRPSLKENPELRKAFESGGIVGFWRKHLQLYGSEFDYYFSPAKHTLSPKEMDAAFACLEQMYRSRSSRLPQINVNPRFDAVREDPRFHDLLVRMNLSTQP